MHAATRHAAAAAAGAALLLLAGCVEEEVSVVLREDGSGTAVIAGRMTPAATRLVALMDEPGGGTILHHLGPDDFGFRTPAEAVGADLARAGLRVTGCVSRRDAEEVSARLDVAFDRVESLSLVGNLRSRGGPWDEGKPAVGPLRFELAPAPEGSWTLTVTTPPIELSGGSAAVDEPGARPDREKLHAKLKACAALADEGLRAKGTISLAVPGTILGASPEEGMTPGEGRRSWAVDLDGLFNLAVSRGWDPGSGAVALPPVAFQVRFRLPEGKSFPAPDPAAAAGAAADAEARERLRAGIAEAYARPRGKATPETRRERAAAREAFLRSVASDLPARLPLLREAAWAAKGPFLLDGARLLAAHGEGRGDLQLAADAAARAPLDGATEAEYLDLCLLLCRGDADAFAAVARLLDDPPFAAPAPGAPAALPRDRAVLLGLLACGEERWVGRLVGRLPGEEDAAAAAAILRCLAHAVTPEADAAVRAAAEDGTGDPFLARTARLLVLESAPPPLPGTAPAAGRAGFEGFLARAEEDGRLPADGAAAAAREEALHHVRAGDAPRIRAIRRAAARGGGEEALRDVALLTGLLRRAAALGE